VLEANLSVQLKPDYQRFRSLGFDLETALGGFTVRAEGAFKFRRPYSFDLNSLFQRIRDDQALVNQIANSSTPVAVPAFVLRDSVDWGIGADYLYEGWLALLELYQVLLLNNDQRLLVRDVDTRLAVNLEKRLLQDRLLARLLGVWAIESSYEVARSELSYEVMDGLTVRAGVLGIWGSRNSLIGEFHRNGELYAGVRYSF
jgi:hypothetical protein